MAAEESKQSWCKFMHAPYIALLMSYGMEDKASLTLALPVSIWCRAHFLPAIKDKSSYGSTGSATDVLYVTLACMLCAGLWPSSALCG